MVRCVHAPNLQTGVNAQAFLALVAERSRSTNKFLKSYMSCTWGGWF